MNLIKLCCDVFVIIKSHLNKELRESLKVDGFKRDLQDCNLLWLIENQTYLINNAIYIEGVGWVGIVIDGKDIYLDTFDSVGGELAKYCIQVMLSNSKTKGVLSYVSF